MRSGQWHSCHRTEAGTLAQHDLSRDQAQLGDTQRETSTIGPLLHNGMLIEPHVDRRQESWQPIRRFVTTCKTGLPGS